MGDQHSLPSDGESKRRKTNPHLRGFVSPSRFCLSSTETKKLFKNQLRLEVTYRATISMGTQKTGCRWDDELGGPTRWRRYFREMVTFTWPRFRVCILHRLFRLLESNWHKILQFILQKPCFLHQVALVKLSWKRTRLSEVQDAPTR